MGVDSVSYPFGGFVVGADAVAIPAQTFAWRADYSEFPEVVKIESLVNGQVRKIMAIEEEIVTGAAVEILRAKGYVVVEPIDLMV